ncbi:amidohydrolase [Euzebya sp.]|uniref:amidohydrolase n=1 Tax=Euzebya sp. TaxID=1971409 RepID=UPI0035167002
MTDVPSPRRTVYVAAGAVSIAGADRTHRAVAVEGSTITWTGSPEDAPPDADVVDLGGAWLLPGFVDAHVHATATGLQATGVDLRGARSAADVVAAVRAHVAHDDHRVVHGSGWDDHGWADGPPTAAALADAAPGCTVVLTRVDGHSVLVDAGTLAGLDLRGHEGHVHRGPDGLPSGLLSEGAAAAAQAIVPARLSPGQLDAARRRACGRALAVGITTIHEMGVPGLSERADAVAWATGPWPLTVHAYWAAPPCDVDLDPDGVLLPGGDLFLDGSIGSCTAATSQPYRTDDGGTGDGELLVDDDDLRGLFTAATARGIGVGVHAIGDRAVAQALRVLGRVADDLGVDAVRAARHRIEHVEVISRRQVAAMAHLGVVASVQPAFDATWNGPDGLYEHRFGRRAADRTNPFAWFADAGVALCLSSDSPVTPLDPWGGVLAAERHAGGLSIDRLAALRAATVGGHHAVRADDRVGALAPGQRADIVAWPGDPLVEDPSGWTPVAVISRGILRAIE